MNYDLLVIGGVAFGGATKAEVTHAKEQLTALQAPAAAAPTAKVEGAISAAQLPRP